MKAPANPFAATADRRQTASGILAGEAPAQTQAPSAVLPVELPGAAVPGLFLEIVLPWPDAGLSPNARGTWRKRARLVKEYRKACADAAWAQGVNPTIGLRLDAITFCPPDARQHDDDNLTNRFKAGRDGLADALGVDDFAFRPTINIGPKQPGGAVRVTLTIIPG